MERSGNFYKAIQLGYILISILIGCMAYHIRSVLSINRGGIPKAAPQVQWLDLRSPDAGALDKPLCRAGEGLECER